jgi:hypothetical protein
VPDRADVAAHPAEAAAFERFLGIFDMTECSHDFA